MASQDYSELIASSSNIHEIIYQFLNELRDFKTGVEEELSKINELANSVHWEGEQANQFINSVENSTANISMTLTKTIEIEEKLEAKAEHWAEILRKLNALNNK